MPDCITLKTFDADAINLIIDKAIEIKAEQERWADSLDGKSLVPPLEGHAPDWPDRMLFSYRVGRGEPLPISGAVRTQRYRLVCADRPGKPRRCIRPTNSSSVTSRWRSTSMRLARTG